MYGALVAIVSYVPKETQRTQGQWDRYHVIIWRSSRSPHTARPVICATRERLQDGKRACRTTTITAKSPTAHPAPTPKPRKNGIDPIITQHTAPHRHHAPIRPPTPPRTARPHSSPRTARPASTIEPLAPTTPQNMPPPSHPTQRPMRGIRRPTRGSTGRPTHTDTCRTTTPIPPRQKARSCTMGCDSRESSNRQPSSRLDYCATHSNRQTRRGTMGRKNLHIVEYSAPEPRVPASEETRLELSPFCLEARTAPRTYPNISQPVNPHFPPIERIPVPVTPFPRMFRDDPEPA